MNIRARLSRRQATAVVGGAIGGLAGTLLMQQTMKFGSRLPDALRPPMPRRDPGDFMIRQAERAVGKPLPPALHGTAAHALHFAYGVTWPLILAVFAPRARLHRVRDAITAGALVGVGVWAVGYLGWLPAARLVPPPGKQGLAPSAMGLLGHAAYGIVSVLPITAGQRWLDAASSARRRGRAAWRVAGEERAQA